MNPDEYRDALDAEIDQLGRVLKYLGLAQTAAARSDFGWEPAPLLMKIIAERVVRYSKKEKAVVVTEHDKSFVRLLMMRAFGDVSEEIYDATKFCCVVLAALGLMKKGMPGGYKPTRRLRDLLVHKCLQQPSEAARS